MHVRLLNSKRLEVSEWSRNGLRYSTIAELVCSVLSFGGFLRWRGDSSKGESSNFESKRQTDTKSRKNPE